MDLPFLQNIEAGTLASVIAQARHTLHANLFDQFIIDQF